MSNPQCKVCQAILRKNGFTSSGLQRYRCNNGCSQDNNLPRGKAKSGKALSQAERSRRYRERLTIPLKREVIDESLEDYFSE